MKLSERLPIEKLKEALFLGSHSFASWPSSPAPPDAGAAQQEHVEPFRVLKAEDLPIRTNDQRWLIEWLWATEGVGIIGAHPKSRKTWLALEMAVAVASGTPCLGRFGVAEPGPTLVVVAEDQQADVRERLQLLAESRGRDLRGLPVNYVEEARVLLDSEDDCRRLKMTVEAVQPKLLVLDPLVRLHTGDEDDAGHIARVLGYLRGLQREFQVAIALVHHYKKSFSARGPDGLALRGSVDLHAWGDTNLYIRGTESSGLTLRAEHRSSPGGGPWRLVIDETPFALSAQDVREDDLTLSNDPVKAPAKDRIVEVLRGALGSMSATNIREKAKVRYADASRALRDLVDEGAVQRDEDGRYRLSGGD